MLCTKENKNNQIEPKSLPNPVRENAQKVKGGQLIPLGEESQFLYNLILFQIDLYKKYLSLVVTYYHCPKRTPESRTNLAKLHLTEKQVFSNIKSSPCFSIISNVL